MKKQLITLSAIFILLSIGLYILNKLIPEYSFGILETGNVLMLVLSFLAIYMVSLQTGKPGGAFVRGVTGASFLKLMVCLFAALIYIITNRATLYKPTIFVLFGIYIIYTTSETMLLSKIARTVK